jgi:hypothetical protein
MLHEKLTNTATVATPAYSTIGDSTGQNTSKKYFARGAKPTPKKHFMLWLFAAFLYCCVPAVVKGQSTDFTCTFQNNDAEFVYRGYSIVTAHVNISTSATNVSSIQVSVPNTFEFVSTTISNLGALNPVTPIPTIVATPITTNLDIAAGELVIYNFRLASGNIIAGIYDIQFRYIGTTCPVSATPNNNNLFFDCNANGVVNVSTGIEALILAPAGSNVLPLSFGGGFAAATDPGIQIPADGRICNISAIPPATQFGNFNDSQTRQFTIQFNPRVKTGIDNGVVFKLKVTQEKGIDITSLSYIADDGSNTQIDLDATLISPYYDNGNGTESWTFTIPYSHVPLDGELILTEVFTYSCNTIGEEFSTVSVSVPKFNCSNISSILPISSVNVNAIMNDDMNITTSSNLISNPDNSSGNCIPKYTYEVDFNFTSVNPVEVNTITIPIDNSYYNFDNNYIVINNNGIDITLIDDDLNTLPNINSPTLNIPSAYLDFSPGGTTVTLKLKLYLQSLVPTWDGYSISTDGTKYRINNENATFPKYRISIPLVANITNSQACNDPAIRLTPVTDNKITFNITGQCDVSGSNSDVSFDLPNIMASNQASTVICNTTDPLGNNISNILGVSTQVNFSGTITVPAVSPFNVFQTNAGSPALQPFNPSIACSEPKYRIKIKSDNPNGFGYFINSSVTFNTFLVTPPAGPFTNGEVFIDIDQQVIDNAPQGPDGSKIIDFKFNVHNIPCPSNTIPFGDVTFTVTVQAVCEDCVENVRNLGCENATLLYHCPGACDGLIPVHTETLKGKIERTTFGWTSSDEYSNGTAAIADANDLDNLIIQEYFSTHGNTYPTSVYVNTEKSSQLNRLYPYDIFNVHVEGSIQQVGTQDNTHVALKMSYPQRPELPNNGDFFELVSCDFRYSLDNGSTYTPLILTHTLTTPPIAANSDPHERYLYWDVNDLIAVSGGITFNDGNLYPLIIDAKFRVNQPLSTDPTSTSCSFDIECQFTARDVSSTSQTIEGGLGQRTSCDPFRKKVRLIWPTFEMVQTEVLVGGTGPSSEVSGIRANGALELNNETIVGNKTDLACKYSHAIGVKVGGGLGAQKDFLYEFRPIVKWPNTIFAEGLVGLDDFKNGQYGTENFNSYVNHTFKNQNSNAVIQQSLLPAIARTPSVNNVNKYQGLILTFDKPDACPNTVDNDLKDLFVTNDLSQIFNVNRYAYIHDGNDVGPAPFDILPPPPSIATLPSNWEANTSPHKIPTSAPSINFGNPTTNLATIPFNNPGYPFLIRLPDINQQGYPIALRMTLVDAAGVEVSSINNNSGQVELSGLMTNYASGNTIIQKYQNTDYYVFNMGGTNQLTTSGLPAKLLINLGCYGNQFEVKFEKFVFCTPEQCLDFVRGTATSSCEFTDYIVPMRLAQPTSFLPIPVNTFTAINDHQLHWQLTITNPAGNSAINHAVVDFDFNAGLIFNRVTATDNNSNTINVTPNPQGFELVQGGTGGGLSFDIVSNTFDLTGFLLPAGETITIDVYFDIGGAMCANMTVTDLIRGAVQCFTECNSLINATLNFTNSNLSAALTNIVNSGSGNGIVNGIGDGGYCHPNNTIAAIGFCSSVGNPPPSGANITINNPNADPAAFPLQVSFTDGNPNPINSTFSISSSSVTLPDNNLVGTNTAILSNLTSLTLPFTITVFNPFNGSFITQTINNDIAAPTPVITPNGPTVFSGPGNLTLSSFDQGTSNPLIGTWNTGEFGTQINIANPGIYIVTSTNDCGSGSSNPITVTGDENTGYKSVYYTYGGHSSSATGGFTYDLTEVELGGNAYYLALMKGMKGGSFSCSMVLLNEDMSVVSSIKIPPPTIDKPYTNSQLLKIINLTPGSTNGIYDIVVCGQAFTGLQDNKAFISRYRIDLNPSTISTNTWVQFQSAVGIPNPGNSYWNPAFVDAALDPITNKLYVLTHRSVYISGGGCNSYSPGCMRGTTMMISSFDIDNIYPSLLPPTITANTHHILQNRVFPNQNTYTMGDDVILGSKIKIIGSDAFILARRIYNSPTNAADKKSMAIMMRINLSDILSSNLLDNNTVISTHINMGNTGAALRHSDFEIIGNNLYILASKYEGANNIKPGVIVLPKNFNNVQVVSNQPNNLLPSSQGHLYTWNFNVNPAPIFMNCTKTKIGNRLLIKGWLPVQGNLNNSREFLTMFDPNSNELVEVEGAPGAKAISFNSVFAYTPLYYLRPNMVKGRGNKILLLDEAGTNTTSYAPHITEFNNFVVSGGELKLSLDNLLLGNSGNSSMVSGVSCAQGVTAPTANVSTTSEVTSYAFRDLNPYDLDLPTQYPNWINNPSTTVTPPIAPEPISGINAVYDCQQKPNCKMSIYEEGTATIDANGTITFANYASKCIFDNQTVTITGNNYGGIWMYDNDPTDNQPAVELQPLNTDISITVSTAGTYYVENPTNAYCNIVTQANQNSFLVKVVGFGPTVTQITDPICPGTSVDLSVINIPPTLNPDESITYAWSDGITNYPWSITLPSTSLSTGANDFNVVVTYTNTVSICTATATLNSIVTVLPNHNPTISYPIGTLANITPPIAPSIIPLTTISLCSGGYVSLSGNIYGGRWMKGTAPGIEISQNTSITVTDGGDYWIDNLSLLNQPNFCLVGEFDTEIINPIVTVNVTDPTFLTWGNITPICAGNQVQLNCNTSVNYTSAEWTPVGGIITPTVPLPPPMSSQYTHTPLPPSVTYQATFTDACYTTSDFATVFVDENATSTNILSINSVPPQIADANGVVIICDGATTVTLNSSYSGIWYQKVNPPNGQTLPTSTALNTIPVSSFTTDQNMTGEFWLSPAPNDPNCYASQESNHIIIKNPDVPILTPSTQTVCLGSPVAFEIIGGYNNVYTNWTITDSYSDGIITFNPDYNQFISPISPNSNNSFNVSPVNPTTFPLAITDELELDYCSTPITLSAEVIVNPSYNLSIAGGGDLCFTEGGSLSIANPFNATWDKPSDPNFVTTQIDPIIVTVPGTYTLGLPIASNVCLIEPVVEQEVDVHMNPIQTITPPQTICSGQTVTIAATGGETYLWSPYGETTSDIIVNHTNSNSAIEIHPYSVEVTDECDVINTLTTEVNVLPMLTIDASSLTVGMGVLSSTITVYGAQPGAIYTWYDSDPTIVPTPTPILIGTDAFYVATYAATFYVVVTGNGTCPDETLIIEIGVTPNQQQASISNSAQRICLGGSSTLTVIGGIAYMWDDENNSTSSSITVSPTTTTTYTVNVTEQDGSINRLTSTVSVDKSALGTTIDASGRITGDNETVTLGETVQLYTDVEDVLSYSLTSNPAQACYSLGLNPTFIPLETADIILDASFDNNTCQSNTNIRVEPNNRFSQNGSICNTNLPVAYKVKVVGCEIYTLTSIKNSNGDYDIVLRLSDTDGNLLWTYIYQNSFNRRLDEYATDFDVDPINDVIYISGTIADASNQRSWATTISVTKYNNALTWEELYNYSRKETGGALCYYNGNVYVAATSLLRDNRKVVLLKYEENNTVGNIYNEFSKTTIFSAADYDMPYQFYYSNSNNVLTLLTHSTVSDSWLDNEYWITDNGIDAELANTIPYDAQEIGEPRLPLVFCVPSSLDCEAADSYNEEDNWNSRLANGGFTFEPLENRLSVSSCLSPSNVENRVVRQLPINPSSSWSFSFMFIQNLYVQPNGAAHILAGLSQGNLNPLGVFDESTSSYIASNQDGIFVMLLGDAAEQTNKLYLAAKNQDGNLLIDLRRGIDIGNGIDYTITVNRINQTDFELVVFDGNRAIAEYKTFNTNITTDLAYLQHSNLTFGGDVGITSLESRNIDGFISDFCYNNNLPQSNKNSRIATDNQLVAVKKVDLNSSSLVVYPIPAVGNATLEYTSKDNSPISIQIYSVNGQFIENIYSNMVKEKQQIKVNFDVSKYSSGVYFVKLLSNNSVETKRIVILNK